LSCYKQGRFYCVWYQYRGQKEQLGIRLAENEGARFSLNVAPIAFNIFLLRMLWRMIMVCIKDDHLRTIANFDGKTLKDDHSRTIATFDGKMLKDDHLRTIATFDGKTLKDDHLRTIATFDGKTLKDDHLRTIATFDGKTLKDDHLRTIATVDGSVSIVVISFVMKLFH
jgi:hypothetical protein